jgi:ABC-type branched-subunit amino acid transport system substrate-binding protein
MLRFSAIFAAAMVSASVAAAESDLAGQEIRIGVAGPLTTPSATFGLEMRQAVDLAIDEQDAAGGVLGGRSWGRLSTIKRTRRRERPPPRRCATIRAYSRSSAT